MSKYSLLISLGLLTALLPHLGFPNSFDTVAFAALGLGTAVLAVLVRQERGQNPALEEPVEKLPTHVESKPPPRPPRVKKMAKAPLQIDVMPPPYNVTDMTER